MEESLQMTSVQIRKNCIIIALLLCIALIDGLLAGCAGSGISGNSDTEATEPEISLEQAKEAAFKEAKVKEQDAIVNRRRVVIVDGKPVYEICFIKESKHEDTRYDCTVDGLTGKVSRISKQVETKAPANISKEPEKSGDGSKMDLNDFIGVKKAKTAAVFDSGFAPSEVTFRSVKLVNRGGKMFYVTDFSSSDMDYKFEIDAFTGEVVSREVVYAD